MSFERKRKKNHKDSDEIYDLMFLYLDWNFKPNYFDVKFKDSNSKFLESLINFDSDSFEDP